MRNWTDLLEEQESDLDRAVWTLSEWLNGDAMSLINDCGERFSPRPYYDAMKAIARAIPCPARKSLTGTLYRGVGFQDEQDLTGGRVRTALKRMQSWTPDFKTAKDFACNYGGRYGVVFSADVHANSKAILLCMSDVLAWLHGRPAEIDARAIADHLYQFERYADQQEVIVQGSLVHVSGAKLVKKPRPVRETRQWEKIDTSTHASGWDHYTEIGHRKGKSRVWFLLNGGKLVVRDYEKKLDGHDVGKSDGLESQSIAVGRIDDVQKKISIRTPLAPNNSFLYLTDQKLEVVIRKLSRKFPEYELWYYGQGASDVRRLV